MAKCGSKGFSVFPERSPPEEKSNGGVLGKDAQ